MRDIYARDYRDRSLGAVIARMFSRILPRRRLFERRAGLFGARTGEDGYSYIQPVPMGKRRAR